MNFVKLYNELLGFENSLSDVLLFAKSPFARLLDPVAIGRRVLCRVALAKSAYSYKIGTVDFLSRK